MDLQAFSDYWGCGLNPGLLAITKINIELYSGMDAHVQLPRVVKQDMLC